MPTQPGGIYYGWIIVGAMVLLTALSVPLAGPVTGFFIPSMHAELGIPIAYFGWALSARQLCFALVSPFLGRWVDVHGARGLLIFVGVASGITVFALSYVTEGWQLILCLGLLGLIGLQGAGGDIYAGVTIAKWFNRHRGRAMAIAFIGMPLGIFFTTPLAQYLIEVQGWQSTWQVFGMGAAAVFVVLALFIKRDPSDVGQRPDGGVAEGLTATNVRVVEEHQWTRGEAIRTATFWRISVSFGILMFTISTVAMFRVPHFIDQGIDAQWIAYAYSAEAVISALVAIPVGMLLDRFKAHFLTAIGFSATIVMLILTIQADSIVTVFFATAMFGVGAASVIIIHNTIWPHYFGTQHIGSIRGAAMPITLGFAILGAPVAGMVRDATGSFVSIWWITIGAMAVAILLILMTPKPQKNQ